MRFMMLMIPRDYATAPADARPDPKLVEAMGKYNESMIKAGVMLSGDGLHPSQQGARVRFAGGKPTVTDGPYAQTQDQIGVFFVVEAEDIDEAVQIASLHPSAHHGKFFGGGIEVRPCDFFEGA